MSLLGAIEAAAAGLLEPMLKSEGGPLAAMLALSSAKEAARHSAATRPVGLLVASAGPQEDGAHYMARRCEITLMILNDDARGSDVAASELYPWLEQAARLLDGKLLKLGPYVTSALEVSTMAVAEGEGGEITGTVAATMTVPGYKFGSL